MRASLRYSSASNHDPMNDLKKLITVGAVLAVTVVPLSGTAHAATDGPLTVSDLTDTAAECPLYDVPFAVNTSSDGMWSLWVESNDPTVFPSGDAGTGPRSGTIPVEICGTNLNDNVGTHLLTSTLEVTSADFSTTETFSTTSTITLTAPAPPPATAPSPPRNPYTTVASRRATLHWAYQPRTAEPRSAGIRCSVAPPPPREETSPLQRAAQPSLA